MPGLSVDHPGTSSPRTPPIRRRARRSEATPCSLELGVLESPACRTPPTKASASCNKSVASASAAVCREPFAVSDARCALHRATPAAAAPAAAARLQVTPVAALIRPGSVTVISPSLQAEGTRESTLVVPDSTEGAAVHRRPPRTLEAQVAALDSSLARLQDWANSRPPEPPVVHWLMARTPPPARPHQPCSSNGLLSPSPTSAALSTAPSRNSWSPLSSESAAPPRSSASPPRRTARERFRAIYGRRCEPQAPCFPQLVSPRELDRRWNEADTRLVCGVLEAHMQRSNSSGDFAALPPQLHNVFLRYLLPAGRC